MKILAFSVTAFRSVAATGWLPMSVDGVTALVGQNESGKSAILDALSIGFGTNPKISSDDFRRGESLPRISLKLELASSEVTDLVAALPSEAGGVAAKVLNNVHKELIFTAHFTSSGSDSRVHHFENSVSDALKKEFVALAPEVDESAIKPEPEAYATQLGAKLLSELWAMIPSFVLFREEDNYLPNLVDIDEDKQDWTEDAASSGADNFLASVGLRLQDLLTDDDRERSSLIPTAIREINVTLASFWTQVLGSRGRIKLEVEFSRHPATHTKRPGKAYLRFWISEGDGDKLHPSQRSKGTRWYVAFFLQLIAAQRDGDAIVLLLDEPGAYLHATAQADVLRLITKLAGSIPVLYSTHSPYLIDHKRIDRILAVERDAANEHSNTIVRRGLELAASSHLTLAPVLALMGTDLSAQQLIKRSGNILLEENSAYFYFSAFVVLTGIGADLSFVACNGADNIKLVADLFTAWRLDFKVAFDEDDKGKKVSRELKKKWLLTEEVATNRILLFKGCSGIEDAFERADFARFVAKETLLPNGQPNSKVVEGLRLSKPILAHQFFASVMNGAVNKDDITPETMARFSEWLTWMIN